jgi:hypothetical protein
LEELRRLLTFGTMALKVSTKKRVGTKGILEFSKMDIWKFETAESTDFCQGWKKRIEEIFG